MIKYITEKGNVELTNRNDLHPKMMLYSTLVRMKRGEIKEYFDEEKEMLFVLQEGEVRFSFENTTSLAKRENVFDDAPEGLHVSKDVSVLIEALSDCEYLCFMTENDKRFPATVFDSHNVVVVDRGAGQWNECATRNVRTMVDYSINPDSKMAFGETVNYPGKWSTFIPHLHEQPELYYYRFNRPEGFGASFYGDDVYQVKDRSYLCVEEYLPHPQVTAPGYAMYYFWIIRHFDDHPWTGAANVKAHEWLLEPDCKIWPKR